MILDLSREIAKTFEGINSIASTDGEGEMSVGEMDAKMSLLYLRLIALAVLSISANLNNMQPRFTPNIRN